jgi:hypothetical protein
VLGKVYSIIGLSFVRSIEARLQLDLLARREARRDDVGRMNPGHPRIDRAGLAPKRTGDLDPALELGRCGDPFEGGVELVSSIATPRWVMPADSARSTPGSPHSEPGAMLLAICSRSASELPLGGLDLEAYIVVDQIRARRIDKVIVGLAAGRIRALLLLRIERDIRSREIAPAPAPVAGA